MSGMTMTQFFLERPFLSIDLRNKTLVPLVTQSDYSSLILILILYNTLVGLCPYQIASDRVRIALWKLLEVQFDFSQVSSTIILTVPNVKDIIDESDSGMSLTQDIEDLAIHASQSPQSPATLSSQFSATPLSGQLL